MNYQLEINGELVKNETEKLGLQFEIAEKWISDKILSVKLHLELNSVSIFLGNFEIMDFPAKSIFAQKFK